MDAIDVAVVATLALVVAAGLAWLHPSLVASVGAVALAGIWRGVRG